MSIIRAKHELWRRGNLRFKLWQQQEPIYKSVRALPKSVDEVVILCARQFGKSYLGTLMAVEDCLKFPEKCILVIGPTIKQTREIVAPRIRHIGRDAPPGLIRPSKSEGKWYIGKSELVMGGFDQNSSAQRGKTVQNVYIEEIVDSNPDDYLEALRSDLGPALTHSDAGKIIYLTTLPKVPDHPFITETMSRAAINNCLYVYTIHDNKELTKEQYDACVRRAGGEETDDWRREYLCQIVRDRSVVVIPDFEPKRHVGACDLPPFVNLEVYIDWGGVRDLTVALLMGYEFLTDTDLVLDEKWFKPNTPTEVIVAELQAWYDTHTIKRTYADVPGQLQVDLKSSHDFDVAIPFKADWQASINQLAVRFSRNKIKIDPKCKLTIQTCQSGTFNKQRTDFERTTSLGHCDALAALGYGHRSLDRSNPFPNNSLGNDYIFVKPKEDQEKPSEVKAFGTARPKVRRFGTFNK
jgi:hypothetical protein